VVPSLPRDGERVELTLTVRNDGSLASSASVLRWFDGAPESGGVMVDEREVPALGPGAAAVITARWDTLDAEGPHTLVAVLDPDAVVAELSELDNRASVDVTVEAAPDEADLEIRAPEIALDPAVLGTLPQQVAVSAFVRNLGRTGVAAATVALWLGEPGTGVQVGSQVVAVAERSTVVANFVVVVASAQERRLTIVLDPAGEVAEADETNNVAQAELDVVALVDLTVDAADFVLTPPTGVLGVDMTFRVVVRNTGTVDAPSATLRLTVGDGTVTRLVSEQSLVLAAGASAERTVPWRPDLEGTLTFAAEIDPEGLVPEGDEADNRAEQPFEVAASAAVNLVVVGGDLTLLPDPPRVGVASELALRVRNLGGATSLATHVDFVEGSPGSGVLLARVVLEPIAAGGETVVATSWSPADGEPRLLSALVDPDDVIVEESESDNTTFLST
jgi:subtilase family serine protease